VRCARCTHWECACSGGVERAGQGFAPI